MAKSIQLSNVEFWSLVVAVIALVASLTAIAVGLIWSARQKAVEIKIARAAQYYDLIDRIADNTSHAMQVSAIVMLAQFPEFKEATTFTLLQIRDAIDGGGRGRMIAAIDKTVSDLTGKKK